MFFFAYLWYDFNSTQFVSSSSRSVVMCMHIYDRFGLRDVNIYLVLCCYQRPGAMPKVSMRRKGHCDGFSGWWSGHLAYKPLPWLRGYYRGITFVYPSFCLWKRSGRKLVRSSDKKYLNPFTVIRRIIFGLRRAALLFLRNWKHDKEVR